MKTGFLFLFCFLGLCCTLTVLATVLLILITFSSPTFLCDLERKWVRWVKLCVAKEEAGQESHCLCLLFIWVTYWRRSSGKSCWKSGTMSNSRATFSHRLIRAIRELNRKSFLSTTVRLNYPFVWFISGLYGWNPLISLITLVQSRSCCADRQTDRQTGSRAVDTGRKEDFELQLGGFSLLHETSQPAQSRKPAD